MELPLNLERTDLGMTNFDHSIDVGLEDALRQGKMGEHTAWNFHGLVWWDPEADRFYEYVSVLRVHRATIDAATLDDLMRAVNERFGFE